MRDLKMSGPPELATKIDDRRRHPRRPVRATIGKLDTPDRVSKPVEVTDLSAHGVGFCTTEALVIGRKYALEIKGNWINLSSRIRVVSCRAGEVGAEFC